MYLTIFSQSYTCQLLNFFISACNWSLSFQFMPDYDIHDFALHYCRNVYNFGAYSLVPRLMIIALEWRFIHSRMNLCIVYIPIFSAMYYWRSGTCVYVLLRNVPTIITHGFLWIMDCSLSHLFPLSTMKLGITTLI